MALVAAFNEISDGLVMIASAHATLARIDPDNTERHVFLVTVCVEAANTNLDAARAVLQALDRG